MWGGEANVGISVGGCAEIWKREGSGKGRGRSVRGGGGGRLRVG